MPPTIVPIISVPESLGTTSAEAISTILPVDSTVFVPFPPFETSSSVVEVPGPPPSSTTSVEVGVGVGTTEPPDTTPVPATTSQVAVVPESSPTSTPIIPKTTSNVVSQTVNPGGSVSTSSPSPSTKSSTSASTLLSSSSSSYSLTLSTSTTSSYAPSSLSRTSSSVTSSTSSTTPPTSLAPSPSSTTTSSLPPLTGSSSPLPSTSTAPLPITTSHHTGLSSGAKAGIGIGVALGLLFVLGLVLFAFWWGRRSAQRKLNPNIAELGAGRPRGSELMGEPLNEDEKKELERRRRAAELEARAPVEIGAGGERAELESRRKMARDLFEMG